MKAVIGGLALVLVTLGGAVGGAYWLSLSAIHSSQQQWCTTLALLTSRPVPRPADPQANPSRQDAYLFYVHLATLERDFGC